MELIDVKGVGAKTLEKLKKLGIENIRDVIYFYPKFYWDMTKETVLDEIESGDYVLLKGTLTSISGLIRAKRGLTFCTATLNTQGKKIKLTWFNSPFVLSLIKQEGEFLFWGKARFNGKKIEMSNPSFERAEENKRLQGIVPIYPLKDVVGQQLFRNIVKACLESYKVASRLDDYTDMTLDSAFRIVHEPLDMKDCNVARKRIALEELVYQIIAYRVVKNNSDNKKPYPYDEDFSAIEKEIAALPYKLTPSQDKAIREIVADLKGERHTNRMLMGDVGSGKTVIALLSCLFAKKCGRQSSIMAPTEILARQHYKTALTLFGDSLQVALLTASTPAQEKKEIISKLQRGEIDLVVGTHAVLNDKVKFDNLGLIVIDELHRFGVRQKSKLEDKAVGVDVIVMSATPIPRALALSIYGDLDMSTLQPREGTGDNITTFVMGDDKLKGLYKFIKERVSYGEQAYIVCPLVEDSEGLEVFSAKMLYKQLVKKELADLNVGLIYGSMKDKDKSEIMSRFYAGDVDVLVATSVIEVGIDSQRASVMAVLNSDRFGLAGLHQLRGRVGRNPQIKSYCFLHTSKQEENLRLDALRDNKDGLKIAEIDADMRGYGDFLGINQSGGSGKIGVFINKKIIEECKNIADSLMEEGSIFSEYDEMLAKYLAMMQGISLN
ncbi:MAG: ATP-dependent DNA helicase RecG [Clostridiales bacterium]|nr:ATP-dependent DNA helicase RecG [Clostridiales bacterium]